MGVGIIAFGLIFNPVEFLQVSRKRKRRSSTVQLGQKGHSAAGPDGFQPTRGCHVEGVKAKYAFSRRSEPVRARACLNLMGGSHPSGRETDGQGPRPSSSTSVQGRRRARRRRYRAREGAWVVPLDSGGCHRSGGGGDGRLSSLVRRRRGSRRRSFGRRRLRPFPAAKEAGKKGEMVRRA